jgi:hypothetical protein
VDVTDEDLEQQRSAVDALRAQIAAAKSAQSEQSRAAENELNYTQLVHEEDELKKELARLTGSAEDVQQDGVPIDVLPVAPDATQPTVPEGINVLPPSGHGAPMNEDGTEVIEPAVVETAPSVTGTGLNLDGESTPAPPTDDGPPGESDQTPEVEVSTETQTPDQGTIQTPTGEEG